MNISHELAKLEAHGFISSSGCAVEPVDRNRTRPFNLSKNGDPDVMTLTQTLLTPIEASEARHQYMRKQVCIASSASAMKSKSTKNDYNFPEIGDIVSPWLQ